MQITYIGYLTQTAKVKVGGKKPAVLKLNMESRTLTAVEVVADIAKTRETPVAFANIDAKRIEEELASRDIPMLLTSTPGVYATMGGGGQGDGRVTIRGFDQSNIGILVDGIPTNDMESGVVYWSDWAGLGDITRNIQVQRGLGASKLAIASVGGTINIITKGLEANKSISYAQEYGSDMMLKETLCLTTGRLKGDWGITASGTRKTGDGWVAATPFDQWSYFIKAEKRIKNHTISVSANSAPQTHGQRGYNQLIGVYDKAYAEKMGINYNPTYPASTSPSPAGNFGTNYNQQWGVLDRWEGSRHDTTSHSVSNVNTRVNFFNKPLYNLNDYWTINDKLYLSTVLYASTGSGGGTNLWVAPGANLLSNGQTNLQTIYNDNKTNYFGITTLAPGHKSSNFIYAAMNDHQWFGMLSTLTYNLTKDITVTVGPDLRWYRGHHYDKVYDLLGGDYYADFANPNQTSPVKRVGDTFAKDYDSYINYGGGFLQTEYVKNKVSAFATVTGVQTSYQRVDNFDTTKQFHKSPLMEYYGYGLKAGSNYNFNEHHNLFFNTGYMVKAPTFGSVFDYNNIPSTDVKNQQITSVEMGYGYKTRMFAANVNAYYTDWQNRPQQYPIAVTSGNNTFYAMVNGMNALHKGVEMDLQFKPIQKVTVGGIVSIADWRWTSNGRSTVTDANGNFVESVSFTAKNMHVGNAPQSQFGLNVRYEPFKNFYVKAQWTYFARIYAQFDPTTMNTTDPTQTNYNLYLVNHPGIDAWRLPDYQLVDIHAGYKFTLYRFDIVMAAHVINLFNTEYISEATNGGSFDASTSMVYFGQGRSFLLSMKVLFK